MAAGPTQDGEAGRVGGALPYGQQTAESLPREGGCIQHFQQDADLRQFLQAGDKACGCQRVGGFGDEVAGEEGAFEGRKDFRPGFRHGRVVGEDVQICKSGSVIFCSRAEMVVSPGTQRDAGSYFGGDARREAFGIQGDVAIAEKMRGRGGAGELRIFEADEECVACRSENLAGGFGFAGETISLGGCLEGFG